MGAPLRLALTADDVATIASTLKIKIHKGGHSALWAPNPEQFKYWRTRENFEGWTFVAKPRQIGLSTAVCLEDVLWTQQADADGHVVKCAIVVDTYDHAKERIDCCASFAQQLGFVAETDCVDNEVRFPGGSIIVALTAGGKNVGRSTDAQRLHLTEVPHWPNPAKNYTDLVQALSLGCDIVLETTITSDDPFTIETWDGDNEYTKLFFSLEEHGAEYFAVEAYGPAPIDDEGNERAVTELKAQGLTVHGISDERFAELQDRDPDTNVPRRFTKRESAAWFDWAIINKCGGDEVRASHEYPQRVEDMFTSAKGRWIRVDPVVEMPALRSAPHFAAGRRWPRVLFVPGIDGEQWPVLIWQELSETSKQLAAWVDVSEAKELSHSAITLIDKRNKKLVATFNDGGVLGDDLARILLTVLDAFTDRTELMGIAQPDRRPACRIEAQGVNQTCVQQATRLGIAFEAYTMTEERRNDQLLEVKRAIEGGSITEGPPRLAYECRNLARDELGRWKGPKDLLMTIGGALVMAREAPYKDEFARPILNDRNRAVSKRRLRAQRRGRGAYS